MSLRLSGMVGEACPEFGQVGLTDCQRLVSDWHNLGRVNRPIKLLSMGP